MERPAATFRSVPTKLRMRILMNTHLGIPDTGGYDEELEFLRIRDGKIVPRHHPMLEPPPESVWSVLVLMPLFPQELKCLADPPRPATAAPLRRLTALQLHSASAACCPYSFISSTNRCVARQLWYSTPTPIFDFSNDNLGSMLSFLRDILPREGLSRLRRLTFTMTEAQCEGWAGGAVASGYPASMLERQVAVPYWGGGPVMITRTTGGQLLPSLRSMRISPSSASPSKWENARGNLSRTP